MLLLIACGLLLPVLHRTLGQDAGDASLWVWRWTHPVKNFLIENPSMPWNPKAPKAFDIPLVSAPVDAQHAKQIQAHGYFPTYAAEPPGLYPLGYLHRAYQDETCPAGVPSATVNTGCTAEEPWKDLSLIYQDWWRPSTAEFSSNGMVVGQFFSFPLEAVLGFHFIGGDQRPCDAERHNQRVKAVASLSNRVWHRMSFFADRRDRGHLIVGVQLPHIDYNDLTQVRLSAAASAANLLQILSLSMWSSVAEYVAYDVRTVSRPDSAPIIEGTRIYHSNRLKNTFFWHTDPNAAKPLFAGSVGYGWLVNHLNSSLVRFCGYTKELRSNEDAISWEQSSDFLKLVLSFFGYDMLESTRLVSKCVANSTEGLETYRPDALVQVEQSEWQAESMASRAGEGGVFCWSIVWAHLRSITTMAYGAYHVLPEALVAAYHANADVNMRSANSLFTPKMHQYDIFVTFLSDVDALVSDDERVSSAAIATEHLLDTYMVLVLRRHLKQEQLGKRPLKQQPFFARVRFTIWKLSLVIPTVARSDIVIVGGGLAAIPQLLVALPPWGGVLELVSNNEPNATQHTRSIANVLGLAYVSFDFDIYERLNYAYLRLSGLHHQVDPEWAGLHSEMPAQYFGMVLADLEAEVANRRLEWLHGATRAAQLLKNDQGDRHNHNQAEEAM